MICLAASYISPSTFSLLPLLGFVFPILVIVNLAFVVVWILRKRWFFLVSFSALLLCVPQLMHLFAFGKNKENVSQHSFKIMSYNVRNFDLYNWSENVEAQAKIFETLKEENPDIICFQEFYSDTSKNFNTIVKLKQLGYKHYFFAKELILRNSDEWGIATFSKYPIVKSEKLLQEDDLNYFKKRPYKCISTDIKFQNQTIRIFNVHLQSIHFGKDEYNLIDNVKNPNHSSIEEKAAKKLIRKLVVGFKERAKQVGRLQKILSEQNIPYMVCGDFNDLPNSYTYNIISKNMKDAFLESGFGVGATFNNNIPFLRIDYILLPKEFQATDFRVIKNPISDHFPVVTNVSY